MSMSDAPRPSRFPATGAAPSSTPARCGSRPRRGSRRVTSRSTRRRSSGRSGLRRNLRWDALDSTYFAGYAMWNYMTTPYLLTRQGVEVARGRAVAPGRRHVAPPRGHVSGRPRHPLAAPDVLLRLPRPAAPPRLRRAGGRRVGARRPPLRRPCRVRRADVPDAALGAPDRPGQPLAAVPDDGVARAARDHGGRREQRPGPVAHQGLALQREGALGARPQAHRAPAAHAAPGRPPACSRCG